MTSTTKIKEDYEKKKTEALKLIEKVKKGIENEEFDTFWGWGNNGSMAHYISQLKELSDQLYKENEYAS